MGTRNDWRPAFEQQTARINVSDETWRRFRRFCLDNGEHLSDVLGRLVDAEVARREPAMTKPTAAKHRGERVDASTREHQATTPPASSSEEAAGALTLFDP